MKYRATLLKHIEHSSQEVRNNSVPADKGWIHQMRVALGLTLGKLGDLSGLTLPSVAQAERGEIQGKLTIETLRKMAEAMNCDFIYTFAPKSDMNEFIQKKAYEKARKILTRADLHMSLENQKVQSDLENRILKLQQKLILEGKVW